VKTAGARYVVVADDGTSCATTSTNCTLLGLEDGTTYTYAVYASTPDGTYWSSSDYVGTPVAAVPDAPTDVSISAGDGQIVVSWNRPDANGSPILSYTAADNLGHSCVTTETYCVITTIPNGQSVSITVRAKNSVGSSGRSQSVSATPMAVPGAPKNLLAAPGDGQVVVTWEAPDGVGSDVSYAVVGTSGSSPIYCITTTTSCVITGLTNGTSYQFAVTTRTANGVSAATSVTNRVSPATVPSAPLIQNTIASSGSVVVTFTTPTDDGGSPILGYLVVSSLGDECRTTSNMCRFDDLANGQPLTFTVVAENAIGASDESAVSAVVTPRGVADSPQNVLALAGDGVVRVSWQAPANNGGSAILRYTVRDQEGHACTTAVRSVCTIDGLTNGVTYTFSVVAVNGVGSSASSSVTATPTTAPSVPTNVSATVKNTTATIRWTASKGWGRDVSYIVSDGTGAECRTAALYCQIAGLTYGEARTFTVVALSDAGISGTSVPSNTVTAAAAPAAPGSLQAVAGKQLVVLSWAAATTNGAAITQYLVSDGAGHTCSTTALTCTVTGLTGGTAYTFKVNATNSVGDSPWSKTATATPAAPPSAPLLTLLTPGDAKFLVNFEPPAGNGSAVSAYYYSFDGGASKVLADWTAGKKFFTVTGLTNGTNYSFQMAASNAVGLGVWTTVTSVMPLTTPGAPTLTTAIASTNSIALTFQAPTSTGGSPITSYLYSLDGGTTWSPRPSGTTSLSFTISGLAGKKTYRVALRAVNKAGSGIISKVMSVTTR
jgi:titin